MKPPPATAPAQVCAAGTAAILSLPCSRNWAMPPPGRRKSWKL
nr:MAG TPA: hypothetical protein [Bacteriophage sp.]